jgi:hypothetical protein
MCGSTPPKAIVARIRVSSSSSPRMASCRWRGVIRFTFRSLAAFCRRCQRDVSHNRREYVCLPLQAPALPLSSTRERQ